ncbi:MAG: STAS domain-containing protein [Bacteroidales bacterium]|jgi:SulP family sulfate permease|nr:STAS domain-containing protein [Bacteroidales bacterium]
MKKFFYPELFNSLKNYNKSQFTKDLFSGVIVGIVALPLAIAFAVASGVSPERGLITAIIAGFLISFLGGSKVQIGGPTGAFVVIILGIINQYGIDGLIISTVLAGIFMIAFGLLKLGSLLKYIPHPLIVGFTSGIAVVIFTTQIPDALGMSITDLPSSFHLKWLCFFENIKEVNFWAVGITVVTILISLFFNKLTNRIPGSFVAILVVTVAVMLLQLPVSTIETNFGEISGNFTFTIPNFEFSNLKNYLSPALTIALLGAIESLLSAVVADGMIGANHKSNTELIGQGIANIITPFFGGIPATGAIARTATNVKNGGRTPIAGIIHALTLLLIMLVFGKWAKLIPMSCLAGILIVVSYNMSGWRSFISIFKNSFFDIIVLLVTFLLTVFVDLTVAIQIGVVLSAILFMKRMADNGQSILKDKDTLIAENYSDIPKEISIYEINGPFFFGVAKSYSEILKSHKSSEAKILIIRMRQVPFIDSTGVTNFKEALRYLQNKRTKIFLSGVQPNVRKELDKNKISIIVGKGNIFDNFDQALAKAKEEIGVF